MAHTLTEKRLCRIWAEAEKSGEWWTANETLYDIAMVLRDQGCVAQVVDDFAFAATIALTRAVYAVKDRVAA